MVADYASPTLDLSSPASYRDLTKPIGALTPARLETFRERYATHYRTLPQPGAEAEAAPEPEPEPEPEP